MSIVTYTTTDHPEWIDYNGHMQDAYYELIFSYAVDVSKMPLVLTPPIGSRQAERYTCWKTTSSS